LVLKKVNTTHASKPKWASLASVVSSQYFDQQEEQKLTAFAEEIATRIDAVAYENTGKIQGQS
jgi:hypothetical protein